MAKPFEAFFISAYTAIIPRLQRSGKNLDGGAFEAELKPGINPKFFAPEYLG
jgi:hypothetical protein